MARKKEKNPYQDTLNLPRTDFPMRARLAEREPEFQRFFKERRIYERMLERRKNAPTFVLHDGPPYSNGHIHLGHALNKILKDIFVKFHALAGFRTPFVPGWDNHGLPIENAVKKENPELQTLLEDPSRLDDAVRLNIRKACRAFALRWVEIQKEEFERLGVFGDFDRPYLTMDPEYEGRELLILADLVEKGYVYRQRMPIHWCPHCRTALAMAEIEYREKTSPSLWFLAEAREVPEELADFRPFHLLVWTTTPWTLFANRAFAFHPEATYVLVEVAGQRLLFARALLPALKERFFEGQEVRVLAEVPGRVLEGARFAHPFLDRESVGVLADFVSLEEGTGIVHIAPGHGREDFEVGQRYGLEVFSPVDEEGRFTDEVPEWARGLTTHEANPRVVDTLRERGTLFHVGEVRHSYPHCWRCHNPLIFRATWQWFLSVDHNDLRKQALSAIDGVTWYPPTSRERIRASVEERPDWVLSRQRIWGVNIPAFRCEACGEVVLEAAVIRHVAEIFRKESADAWYARTPKELLPPGYRCPKCGSDAFAKEHDILDVWFDSGATSLIVLPARDLPWPADMYLEGPDQHRGWFNASLMLAMAEEGRPPYRVVITNGWTVDEEGRAMHKSLGNVIAPQEIIQRYGAEILRLWVISADYTQDMRMGPEIQKRLVDAYRKLRNTLRFLLGNLYDFDPARDALPLEALFPLDRYMLHRHEIFKEEARRAYETFELHRLFHLFMNYMGVDLSSFYLDVLKDRLYTWAPASPGRRSAQTALFTILRDLLVILAPVLTHTAQEAWGFLPGEHSESPFLEDWPPARPEHRDPELASDFERLLQAREAVLLAVEEARRQGVIRDRLEARVRVEAPFADLLKRYEAYLPELFIVSQVTFADENLPVRVEREGVRVALGKARGEKCLRCWMWREDVHEGVCGKCRPVLQELNI